MCCHRSMARVEAVIDELWQQACDIAQQSQRALAPVRRGMVTGQGGVQAPRQAWRTAWW